MVDCECQEKSIEKTHSIRTDKRTNLKDLPEKEKSLKLILNEKFFKKTKTLTKSHRCQERNKDRDSIRNRLKHKLGLSWTKRSITWDLESKDEVETEL